MSEEAGHRDTAESAVRLSVAVTRLRSRMRLEGMTTTGFTESQLAVLQRVINEGPTTAASMAAVEHVSQQAIAQSVAALKKAGLVRGERDETDGRKVLIGVTAAGQKMFDSLLATRKAWLARAIESVVGPRERGHLDTTIELLERLAAADLGSGSGPR